MTTSEKIATVLHSTITVLIFASAARGFLVPEEVGHPIIPFIFIIIGLLTLKWSITGIRAWANLDNEVKK